MAVAFTVPAQATAFYDVNFDPVGFAGSGRFAVDDACLATDGWKAVSSCGPVTLQTAQADLFDTANPLHTINLTFAPPVYTGVFGIYVVNGELDGADTGLVGPQHVTTDPFFDGYYWLQFASGHIPSTITSIASDATALNTPPNTLNATYLWYASCIPTIECPPRAIFTASTVTYTRVNGVPEPGSLALLLGAGGAGWLRRRRQRGG
jgi:hypothetical protein